jgi:transcriptional regulator with XRE-family HTH domain
MSKNSAYQESRRQATIFPKQQAILQQLGENITLAMKRRSLTQQMMAERTGVSRLTVRHIQQGSPRVSMGHYLLALSVLSLADDLAQVAKDDGFGRRLQDIAILDKNKRDNKMASKGKSS